MIASITRKASISLSMLAILTGSSAFSQEICASLVKRGITDEVREAGITSSSSDIRREICSKYESAKQRAANGQVDVSYGLFDGGLSMSYSQLESIASSSCSGSSDLQSAYQAKQKASSLISSKALESFDSCVKNFRDGLHVETDVRDDDVTIVITARYTPPGAGPNQIKIRKPTILTSDTDAIDCSGELSEVKQESTLGTNSKTISCIRKIKEKSSYLGRDVVSKPITIVIETDAGRIVRHLPSIYAPASFDELQRINLKLGKLESVVNESYHSQKVCLVFEKYDGRPAIGADPAIPPHEIFLAMVPIDNNGNTAVCEKIMQSFLVGRDKAPYMRGNMKFEPMCIVSGEFVRGDSKRCKF